MVGDKVGPVLCEFRYPRQSHLDLIFGSQRVEEADQLIEVKHITNHAWPDSFRCCRSFRRFLPGRGQGPG